jgi:hypothetical protein
MFWKTSTTCINPVHILEDISNLAQKKILMYWAGVWECVPTQLQACAKAQRLKGHKFIRIQN